MTTETRKPVRLDDLDRNILRVLQADAGQSLDEIARQVGS
ncbi:MAG: AsnC family transcriptional regulator, partial [Jannaschia helgolandensis]